MDINEVVEMAMHGWKTDEELKSVYNKLMNLDYSDEDIKVLHRTRALEYLSNAYNRCFGWPDEH